MKKWYSLLCFTGFWLVPVGAAVWIGFCKCMEPETAVTEGMLFMGAKIGFCGMLYALLVNLFTQANGKHPLRDYRALDFLQLEKDAWVHSTNKSKAKYPEIPADLLRKPSASSNSIIIGEQGGKLVCIGLKPGVANHMLVEGLTGSAKTSGILLPTLQSIDSTDASGKVLLTHVSVDIKLELWEKAADQTIVTGKNQEPANILLNPKDRTSWGYDVFYDIRQAQEPQQVYDAIATVVETLIPVRKSDRNSYFYERARDLMKGFLLAYWDYGVTGFIGMVNEISSSPLREQIKSLKENIPGSRGCRILTMFDGMPEETFGCVSDNMFNAISFFANNHDVQYLLSGNPQKANPSMLEDHNLYLGVPEHMIEQYSPLLNLMITQCMEYILKRPENSHPILVCVDELGAIIAKAGPIKALNTFLMTARSRGGVFLGIMQQCDVLNEAYGKDMAQGILGNMNYRVILSASSEQTCKDIIRLAGKYEENQRSHGTTGKGKSANYSRQEKDILTSNDLLTLPKQGEVVVISSADGYFRPRKTAYYRQPYLKKRWISIQEKNAAWKNIQETGR